MYIPKRVCVLFGKSSQDTWRITECLLTKTVKPVNIATDGQVKNNKPTLF